MEKVFLRRVASIIFLFVLTFSFFASPRVNAEDAYSGPIIGFMMSPMTERLTLKPGESQSSSFYIMNPEENTISVDYGLKIQSFYRDPDNNAIFEDVEGRGQIAKWITLNVPDSGTLAPGESTRVDYTIEVPYNVPAGGQYAAITATSSFDDQEQPNSTALKETVAMAHTIFAEIEGETVRSGKITNLELPSFLLDGNISATSMVSNIGNIHGTATYTLEVFPLFSSEPIYTNEDEPDKKLILPDRTLFYKTSWENTPTVGIFNVYYKVEFESGVVEEISKLVIKCPLWLLLVIIPGIVSLGIFIIFRIRRRHKKPNLPVEKN